MALVFGDSFDHYTYSDLLKKWSTSSTPPSLASSLSILTDKGVPLPPHAACLAIYNNENLVKTLPANLQTFICGFNISVNWTSTVRTIATFNDSATPANNHLLLRYDATGHLAIVSNATLLATSTNVLVNQTWYHLEIKATIGDAAGSPAGAYEVRINGSSVNWLPAATGVDTRNAGNANIGSVRLYGGDNSSVLSSHRVNDFYILDTTGSVASDFLGPCRFQVIRPSGTGTTAEWTGNYADNWQNVTDQFADGDATFNQSSTAGQTDQFAMSDVPSGTVHAIQHVVEARKDAGAARTIRPVTRISGTDYNGTTVALASSYAFVTEPISVSPASSSAWTDTEVNALEGGYELVS